MPRRNTGKMFRINRKVRNEKARLVAKTVKGANIPVVVRWSDVRMFAY